MKICPVCRAAAFDDAEICFGCMHRFGDEAEEVSVPLETLPEFRITFTPMRTPSGTLTWSCAVEV